MTFVLACIDPLVRWSGNESEDGKFTKEYLEAVGLLRLLPTAVTDRAKDPAWWGDTVSGQ